MHSETSDPTKPAGKGGARSASFRNAIKGLYAVISVITTLAVFCLLILLCAESLRGGESGDDLIMREIKRQVSPDLRIVSITAQDIHGFGNDSIVVLAAAERQGTEEEGRINNQLLVFDRAGNDLRDRLRGLFGRGSGFRLAYKFSLADSYGFPELGFTIRLLDVVELTGDLSRELVVLFRPEPSGTSGIGEVGVFSCLPGDRGYYLLGTFPPAELYDLGESHRGWQLAPTEFRTEGWGKHDRYAPDETFRLESVSTDNNDIFIENDSGTVYLLRTRMIWGDHESHVDPHRHVISAFLPRYDAEKDELEWYVTFSKETEAYTTYCTKEFILDFLRENERYEIVGYDRETGG